MGRGKRKPKDTYGDEGPRKEKHGYGGDGDHRGAVSLCISSEGTRGLGDLEVNVVVYLG